MTPTGDSVLIVGSVALDSVETPAGKVEQALGGAAVYSSVAASFFAPVNLVGVVGEDFPEPHLEFLASRGIDLKGLKIVADKKTFRWKGAYYADMNEAQTISTELNAFENFDPEIPDQYRRSKYVFLANIDPELQLKVLSQVNSPVLTACDTMNFWIDRKREKLLEVLGWVDVAFMNDAEARQLTGEVNLNRAAHTLHKFGPRYVVIKKGEHGAVLYCDSDICFMAAPYPLYDVVDPTGAGDSFAGGFMGYLARVGNVNRDNLRRAVVYGSVLASFNVQDFSLNKLRSLTMEDINRRCEEFRRIVHFEPAE
ncbi:MAG: PfkB family carbohydrate kinase [Armatimonadota bacterium]